MVASTTPPALADRSLEPRVEPWMACSPEQAATRLRGRPGLVWLDSALRHEETGRWSILASDPRWTVTAYAGDVVVDGVCGPRRLQGGALTSFAALVETEPRIHAPQGLPFAGGAIGYLGFELGREVERLPANTTDDTGVPELAFGWYDAALVWDHAEERGWLAGRPDAVAALRAHLEAAGDAADPPDQRAAGCVAHDAVLRSNMTYEQYEAAVDRARAYIAAGDIYQVNLAQRFSIPLSAEGFEVYRRLRAASPAPFAAYLDLRGTFSAVEVLSSSPERFLLADAGRLETRPIKGTRPRGRDPEADDRLADELRASRKDLAEHVMIVDLERNDLGRVAQPGSVRVPRFASLESYRHVHHLVSVVEAERRPEVGLEALLRATFPGGSISGAPKVRALEIIDELEPHVRGVYCGAVGYVSASGRVDLNIAIRTITLVDGVARFHVGGAIVDDSRPASEYAETLDKARGMARALGVALPDEPGGGAS
jgi:para-aminobenzoate synthetase component 1